MKQLKKVPELVPARGGRDQESCVGQASPIDDKPAYALMDSKGRIICYATASPGVDLDRYLNQSVSLYGSLETRGTIRGGPYMVVAQTK